MSIMPEGVKIYFGDSLKKKIFIENRLKDIFEKNSYELIELPMYEYYHDLESEFSDTMKKKMFKFVDRDSGEVLALRPDMTSLLAKLIKLKNDEENIQRIYYNGDVFRYDKFKSGINREICQAGIELIGGDGFKSELEVLTIAIESLKKLGLNNVKLEIGDVSIFNAIVEKYNVSKEQTNIIKDFITKKDLPLLEAYLKENNINDIFLRLPMLIGSKEILEEVKEFGSDKLKEVLDTLDELGYSDNYIIDLGIVKEMEYYSGIVFNGFSETARDYILTGGRYDKLMNTTALGFVIDVDKTVNLVSKYSSNDANGYYIIGKSYKDMLKAKTELINEGFRSEINFNFESFEKAKAEASSKNFKFILNIDTDEKTELVGDM